MKKRTHLATLARTLKHHFVPHAGNDYHPHALRTKWALVYGGALLATKALVVVYALALPVTAFLAPDVLAGQQAKIITLSNAVREEKGLPPLALASKLTNSAQSKADDMAANGYFSHQSPAGHGLSFFLGKADYKYSSAGENLAMGFSDAAAVVDGWVRSPKHYANLVDPDFQQFGVGVEEGEYGGKPTVFVAQHFGTPLALAPDAPQLPAPEPTAVASVPAPIAKETPPAPAVPAERPPQEPVRWEEVSPVPRKGEVVVVSPVRAVSSTFGLASVPPKRPVPVATAPVKPVARVVLPATPPIPLPEAVQASPVPSTPPLERPVPQVPVSLVEDGSFVAWADTPTGGTRLDVRANVAGEVTHVAALVDGYPIQLAPAPGKPGQFVGSLAIAESSDALFRSVVQPNITLVDKSGTVTQATLDWQHPKVVSLTPWQTYTQARDRFSVVPSVFRWSKQAYGAFLLLVSVLLAFAVVMEWERRRPHVVLHAMSYVLLLFFLWKV